MFFLLSFFLMMTHFKTKFMVRCMTIELVCMLFLFLSAVCLQLLYGSIKSFRYLILRLLAQSVKPLQC